MDGRAASVRRRIRRLGGGEEERETWTHLHLWHPSTVERATALSIGRDDNIFRVEQVFLTIV
eukprot:scaffold1663_cov171-Amphora_coffeaeformis.AAC.13